MKLRRPTAPNTPRLVQVQAVRGVPRTVDGKAVQQVRNDWLIEDKWWTGRPLRRRYWEVLTVSGGCLVLFCDLETHSWYRQGG
jgi:hypothetical protein